MSEGVITLKNQPSVLSFASVAGKKEAEGPLKEYFDVIENDTTMGMDSWEMAESRFQQTAFKTALKKGGLEEKDIELVFAGDLQSQCTAAGYSMRDFSIPFSGTYGACSTMALTMVLSSLMVNAGYAGRAAAITSSHFCSAEREFRKPIQYGGQRPPTAQWTVTGSGCVIFGNEEKKNMPRAEKVIFGKIRDMGITDSNNMGAAMAPAASETIGRFLQGTDTSPSDYDLILTGDLGAVGTKLLYDIFEREYGENLAHVHKDCGLMIYSLDSQDVNSGGSGCGCSGSVLCSKIMKELCSGELNKVLFVATGALLSQTSAMQGESVPGIAHGILLSGGGMYE